MANSGCFTSDRQPASRRGKSERTKIIESLERNASSEDAFYDSLILRALDKDDTMAYKEVLQRLAPLRKAVMPEIEFDLTEAGTPLEKSIEILDAVSKGVLPPDVGIGLINAIRNVLDIEANTELKDRIEKMEDALNA